MRMEWNGIKNIVFLIWLGDKEGVLEEMSYKECMNRFKQGNTIKKGERRRKTLEAGDLEEEEAVQLWREAK